LKIKEKMKFAIIILWAFLIACLMRNAHSSESVIANEKLSQSATDKEKEQSSAVNKIS
jgi:hypothetical protein